jgi:ribosomal protein L11 methyltransferase
VVKPALGIHDDASAHCDARSRCAIGSLVGIEWFECTIEIPAAHSESVANFLIDNGAPGLQSDECGGVARLTAYFSSEPPLHALACFCSAIGCPVPDAEGIRVRQVPNEDWGENWRAHFQPQGVGSRLFICPPWDCAAPAGCLVVVIDPGMAFGTGQHATTRGCLLLLEGAASSGQVTRALDVGTGSGILAIALAKLGLPDVWAVDTDATACAIAEANVATNAVAAPLHICLSLDDVSGTFDLVAANLFANLLEEMTPRLVGLLRPGGVLICSGFLTDDEHRVRRAYESRGLRLQRRHEEQSWVTLALHRPTEP